MQTSPGLAAKAWRTTPSPRRTIDSGPEKGGLAERSPLRSLAIIRRVDFDRERSGTPDTGADRRTFDSTKKNAATIDPSATEIQSDGLRSHNDMPNPAFPIRSITPPTAIAPRSGSGDDVHHKSNVGAKHVKFPTRPVNP